MSILSDGGCNAPVEAADAKIPATALKLDLHNIEI
jgi:hypothetical protein